ncbi:MAG TPA: ribonuclease H-like domain-containing protein [Methanoregula sp.]|nr:ribonuclease H-like domain-containing protein [Methanoregula sp.]
MTAIQVPSGMGALWQHRVNSLKEYEVVRDGNVFGSGFSNSFVVISEYERARSQLDSLVSRYEGIPFSHVFSGSEVTNEGGACFCLRDDFDLPALRFDSDRFREEILADLTLVRGIGKKTQQHLKDHGYRTLCDLAGHPKYRHAATRAIGHLTNRDSAGIMEFICSRRRKSHPFVLGTAGFHEPGEYVFIDIETLGLFSRPITLFGVGTIEGERLKVYQYLLRDIAEEQAALVATMEHLSGDHRALVTFNGRSFDLPYILDRLAYYGMAARPSLPHYDMLHFSRQRWKARFPSCRLSVLEKEVLGVLRGDDIPGQMVPEFYATYLRTGNCGPLVPIVEHNRQDVLSLALLFCHLLGESYGC